jgi:hypothetical protein
MNIHTTTEENGEVNTALYRLNNCWEAVFSVGAALRLYNEDLRWQREN